MPELMKSFEEVFSGPAEACADAPGRVNLLGEHTDYNDGFVLPTAIAARTRVALRRARSPVFTAYAANLAQTANFTLASAPAEPFARYVHGCIRLLAESGVAVAPLDIHVQSDVPIGVGLSSSAALQVALLRALRGLLDLELDDVRIAQLAQTAERRFAHVHCGIMDPLASSLADEKHMLFIDTRTLACRKLRLPAGSEIVVIDSGVARSLATSRYNERREECEQAARLLGVTALRDIVDPAQVAHLPEPFARRARHVVTENNRVLRAAEGVGAAEFGAFMNASHDSLRDDFDVSIPALDRLVAQLQAEPEVYGAKLTGAGFGGACVALCRQGGGAAVARRVLPAYNLHGIAGRLLVPAP